MKPIKIKLEKSVSITKNFVSSEQEEANSNKTKPVKVNVLQKLSSLREEVEKQNIKFNLTPEVECEAQDPASPEPAVAGRSRKKNNQNQAENKMKKEPNSSAQISQKKEWDKINEEWKKIEAARKELNDEKEQILKMKTHIDEERSKLEEEKMQIDEEWGNLHEKKEKMLRDLKVQSVRKSEDDISIVEDDVTIIEESPEKPTRSRHVSSDSLKTPSRKRKMSQKPAKESNKKRKEAKEMARETPRLQLRDFSTLVKEICPSEGADEIIEVHDEEDSNDDAEEQRDLKTFEIEVHRFLADLYKKSNPPGENLSSSLGSKFYNESVESYKMNNGSAIGIAMTKEVKKAIVLKFFLFLEIRKTVEHNLKNSSTIIDKKSISLLSLEFLHDIIESKRVFDEKLVSKDLTEDQKLWITNQIKFKTADLSIFCMK